MFFCCKPITYKFHPSSGVLEIEYVVSPYQIGALEAFLRLGKNTAHGRPINLLKIITAPIEIAVRPLNWQHGALML